MGPSRCFHGCRGHAAVPPCSREAVVAAAAPWLQWRRPARPRRPTEDTEAVATPGPECSLEALAKHPANILFFPLNFASISP